MCRNGHVVLMPLAPQICEGVDGIVLLQFSEWSSFYTVGWVFAVARSAEVDWTGLSSLNAWILYRCDPGLDFDVPEVI